MSTMLYLHLTLGLRIHLGEFTLVLQSSEPAGLSENLRCLNLRPWSLLENLVCLGLVSLSRNLPRYSKHTKPLI